jgi:N-ethylmaleimide reductase
MTSNAVLAPPHLAAGPLLRPFRLSPSLELKNRVAMAPMTRSMAGPGLVPTEAMAAYYARRAAAGLIVTEATIVRADGQGYPDTPGIWSAEQIAGWRRVTERVHQEGGKIFLQLWHVGRVSHPTFLGGELPVAPSAVPLEGRVPRSGDLTYGTPRALELEEIPAFVASYAEGAANAREAGFDGVEIHGANGFLIDQFLHHHTNRRTDVYGGSVEAMQRFALEVVDAVTARVGADRTGLRLSPGAYFNMQGDPRDKAVFVSLLAELESRSLAYVHTGIFDDRQTFPELGGQTASAFLRAHYRGNLIGCGSYTPERGAEAISDGRFDLVAVGRPFIANPDLVDRLKKGDELRPYDEKMLLSLE